ncbi:MAG: fused MFS/spermidine synthase, partial [Fimbriiglobus sp.]
EIDAGVTAVAVEKLGLDPGLRIASFPMDGRQFVAERAAPGSYDLVTLDAVNDLTVPYHLLTKEFHDEARRTLAPGGVYLLTVIDLLDGGRLWASAVRTLSETFPHVQVLTTAPAADPTIRRVYVIYAADVPLDVAILRADLERAGVRNPFTFAVPPAEQNRLLEAARPVRLTDQFAPVDNLMTEVFRRRRADDPE